MAIATQQRIISLAPNLTEILFAIGAGKNIVGVSVDSNFPSAAKQIPIVANAGQLNLEAIIAAKPTLIIAWQGGNPQTQLNELKKFHIPVYTFQFNKLNDIPHAMQLLGKLTHHENQAAKQIQQFNQELSKVNHALINKKTINIFYVIWQTPLMTVGKNTLISQAISLCGGKNIFRDLTLPVPEVSIAAVIKRNPGIIISGLTNPNWKNYWQQWSQITAVKTHRLFFINPDLLLRPGPRFVLGVQQLCGIIREGISAN